MGRVIWIEGRKVIFPSLDTPNSLKPMLTSVLPPKVKEVAKGFLCFTGGLPCNGRHVDNPSVP